MVILLVRLEMTAEAVDALGQQGYLDFRLTRITLCTLVFRNHRTLLINRQRHH
jgi:hypothetical protein